MMTTLQALDEQLTDLRTSATALAAKWQEILSKRRLTDQKYEQELAAIHAREDVSDFTPLDIKNAE